jgi:signal transduction histidine kinase
LREEIRASMAPSQTSAAAPPPQARGRHLWDGIVPEALGLIFVASLFGGLVLTYVAADAAYRATARQVRSDETEVLAQTFAHSLACALEGNNEADVTSLLSGLASTTPQVRSLQWLRPNGTVAFTWPGTVAGDLPTAEAVQCPVTSPDGQPLGSLQLTRSLRAGGGEGLILVWVFGGAGCVVLVAFVLAYRHLRQRLRPAAAIDRNLRRMADGIEQELSTLRLSDGLGVPARGWNQLVEQLERLSGQVSDATADSGGAEVLARFESGNFRRVVDRLPYGVLCVGEDQSITYANKSASALLGRTVDDLLASQISSAVDNPSVTQAVLAAQTRHGAGGTSVDHAQGDDGHEVTLRFRILPLVDRASGATLVTIEDVSQLRAGERARDNFLYHVTHELRTPLTNIHAYTETLTQPGFDDEQTRKECYNVIISETKRLSTLVENILNVSQLEVGTARLDIGEVDLARLVRQMVQDNLGHADEKQIDLTLSLPPKMPKIRGDKQRLSCAAE